MKKGKRIVSSLMVVSYLANPTVNAFAEELKDVDIGNLKNIVQTKENSEVKSQNNLLEEVYLDGTKTSSGTGATQDEAVNSFEKALELVSFGGVIYVAGEVVIPNDVYIPNKLILIRQQEGKDKGILNFEKKLYFNNMVYISDIDLEFSSTDKDCIFLNGAYANLQNTEIIGKPNIFMGSDTENIDKNRTGRLEIYHDNFSNNPIANIYLGGKDGHSIEVAAVSLSNINVEGIVDGRNVNGRSTLGIVEEVSINKVENVKLVDINSNGRLNVPEGMKNVFELYADSSVIKVKNGSKLEGIECIYGELTLDVEVPENDSLKLDNYIKSRTFSGGVTLSDSLIRSGYRPYRKDGDNSVEFYIITRDTVTDHVPVIKNLTAIHLKKGKTIDLRRGIEAWDFEDGDLTSEIEVGQIDLEKLEIGEYEVEYSVTDKDGNKTTLMRKIKVIPNEAPKIHGADNKTITVDEVDDFDLLEGVTVTDDYDKWLKVTTKGNLGKPAIGQKKDYIITYSVTDYDKNTTTVNRVITVTNQVSPIGGLKEVYVDSVIGSTAGTGTEQDPTNSFEGALKLVANNGTIYISGNIVVPNDIETPKDRAIFIYPTENKPKGRLVFQKKLSLGNDLYLDEIEVEFTSKDKDCIFLNGNNLDIYDTEIIGEPNIFLGSENKDVSGKAYIRIAHTNNSNNKIGNINLGGKNGYIDQAEIDIESENVEGIISGSNVKGESKISIQNSLNIQKIENIKTVTVLSNENILVADKIENVENLNVFGNAKVSSNGIEKVGNLITAANAVISSDKPINILNDINSKGTIKLKDGSNLTVGGGIKGDFKLDVELSAGNTLKEGVYVKSKSITGNMELSDNLRNANYRLKRIDGQDYIDFKIFHITTNNKPTITGLTQITIKKGKTADIKNGVKAEDYEDGNLTNKIEFPNNNLSSLPVGEHKITYKVTDSDKNTTTMDRVVKVLSNEAPKINGVKNTTIKVGDVDKFNLLNGITVTDDHDKNLNATVSGKINKPSPGTNKNSTITYTAKDSDGNTTTVSRVITVTNQLPTIDGLSNITIKRGQTVDIKAGVIAKDNEDGVITKNIVYPNTDLSTLPIGKHQITYKVTDSDKNSITKTRIVNVEANSLSKTDLIGKDRYETATKISKEGFKSAKTVILVNGYNAHLVDGLTATPLATALDAPILLSENNSIPKTTVDEIKRLNPSKVVVIGGTGVINQSVINQLNSINKNMSVKRISGKNRYETSLNIAKELDAIVPIKKIYVGAGNGEADSLSISSVAGRDKSPIILASKNSVDTNTYNYLKSKKLSDAYFIGGTGVISNKVIDQINGIVSKNISGNRIDGKNRNETNANVIKKFYPESTLNGAVVAKDYDLVDALAVGPLAAKKTIPVVLAEKSLSTGQEAVLKNKISTKLYQAGGGVSTSVLEKLKKLLTT